MILAASSSDKIDHMDDTDMYRIQQRQQIILQKITVRNADQFTIDEEGQASQGDVTRQSTTSELNSKKRRSKSQILESESDEETEAEDEGGQEERRPQRTQSRDFLGMNFTWLMSNSTESNMSG